MSSGKGNKRMAKQKVRIKGVTKGAFDAVKGATHFSPNYNGAVCGADGNKFADFIGGVTCKRCLRITKGKSK
jgi:hypothetical protein